MPPVALIQMANKIDIRFPTQCPIFSSPPNIERLQDWAESQPTLMQRKIAKSVVNNINYISYDLFLEQLKKTVDDFKQKNRDVPYVLVVAEHREDKLKRGCSEQWVTGLAIEYCDLPQPEAIVTTNQLNDYLQKKPDVQSILILDDAAYSGAQKQIALEELFKPDVQMQYLLDPKPKYNLFLGIPYLTQVAEARIVKSHPCFTPHVLKHNMMPSVMSVLTEEEQLYVKRLEYGFCSPSRTLTYFDHRFADEFSVAQQIKSGRELCERFSPELMRYAGYTTVASVAENDPRIQLVDGEYNRLVTDLVLPNNGESFEWYNIPRIFPPYYFHQEGEPEKIRLAMKDGHIGLKTSVEIHNPAIQLTVETTSIGEDSRSKKAGYKKPLLSLEQQVGFDDAVFAGNWTETTFQKQQVRNLKIAELLRNIHLLGEHGIDLNTIDTKQSDIIRELSSSLEKMVKECFGNNRVVTPSNFNLFKEKFTQKLNANISIIDSKGKQIIANILIALTGVGILILGGQLVHSLYTTGRASFFFNVDEKKQAYINSIKDAGVPIIGKLS